MQVSSSVFSNRSIVESEKISVSNNWVVLHKNSNLMFSTTLTLLNDWTLKESKANRNFISATVASLNQIRQIKYKILRLSVRCKELFEKYPSNYLDRFSIDVGNNLRSKEVQEQIVVLAINTFGPNKLSPSYLQLVPDPKNPQAEKTKFPPIVKRSNKESLLSLQEVIQQAKGDDFILIPPETVIINKNSPTKSLNMNDQSSHDLKYFS